MVIFASLHRLDVPRSTRCSVLHWRLAHTLCRLRCRSLALALGALDCPVAGSCSSLTRQTTIGRRYPPGTGDWPLAAEARREVGGAGLDVSGKAGRDLVRRRRPTTVESGSFGISSMPGSESGDGRRLADTSVAAVGWNVIQKRQAKRQPAGYGRALIGQSRARTRTSGADEVWRRMERRRKRC